MNSGEAQSSEHLKCHTNLAASSELYLYQFIQLLTGVEGVF